MSYLAIGLSVFLLARGLHQGDATTAEGLGLPQCDIVRGRP